MRVRDLERRLHGAIPAWLHGGSAPAGVAWLTQRWQAWSTWCYERLSERERAILATAVPVVLAVSWLYTLGLAGVLLRASLEQRVVTSLPTPEPLVVVVTATPSREELAALGQTEAPPATATPTEPSAPQVIPVGLRSTPGPTETLQPTPTEYTVMPVPPTPTPRRSVRRVEVVAVTNPPTPTPPPSSGRGLGTGLPPGSVPVGPGPGAPGTEPGTGAVPFFGGAPPSGRPSGGAPATAPPGAVPAPAAPPAEPPSPLLALPNFGRPAPAPAPGAPAPAPGEPAPAPFGPGGWSPGAG